MKKLQWYIVNKKYVKYLKPFIGIIININNFNYYVPISSPKKNTIK